MVETLLPLIMLSWLTTPQWLTVHSLASKYRATLSSPLVPLLPICFVSIFSLYPSHLSLPLSLSFLVILSFCPSRCLNLLHIHPRLLNQISISIQLWVFLLNQQEREQPASLPGYCTAHVHHSSLLLSSCYISALTDSIPFAACLFTIYPPLVIVAHSLTSTSRHVLCGVPYFSFGDADGRLEFLS